jgi:hypothetical protein
MFSDSELKVTLLNSINKWKSNLYLVINNLDKLISYYKLQNINILYLNNKLCKISDCDINDGILCTLNEWELLNKELSKPAYLINKITVIYYIGIIIKELTNTLNKLGE